MIGTHVPATAYAEVGARGTYVHDTRVIGKFGYRLGGSVGGMVVDHYHIEVEAGLLAQCATYGVAYGAYAVAHRYYD